MSIPISERFPGVRSRFGSVMATVLASTSVIGAWAGEGDFPRRVPILALGGLLGWGMLRYASQRSHVPMLRLGRWPAYLAVAVILGVAVVHSETEWRAVQKVRVGPYAGVARMVGDSEPVGMGRRLILEIEGQRFEAWVFGSKRNRAASLASGDAVQVMGDRSMFERERVRRQAIRHIVGTFEVSDMDTLPDGDGRSSALVRAANRVRQSIRRGAESLSADRRELFSGLVYGDDSAQSSDMLERFRRSGLAHLTAVSGQNVVFVLAVFGPILTRLPRPARVGLTMLVLVWFAIMTRLEPSVVRAVFMSGVSASAVAVGRPVSSWVALCITISGATLVDPFLVWSVGWWLSVAGCVGLIMATQPMTRLLCRWPRWISAWVAPTIAAQAGVLCVIVAVFGWPSAVSIPCNLLAAPVAGLVMLAGLPTAVVAGFLPDAISRVVMWPIGVGVAWVDAVACLGSVFDPPGYVDAAVGITSAAVVFGAVRNRSRIESRV